MTDKICEFCSSPWNEYWEYEDGCGCDPSKIDFLEKDRERLVGYIKLLINQRDRLIADISKLNEKVKMDIDSIEDLENPLSDSQNAP